MSTVHLYAKLINGPDPEVHLYFLRNGKSKNAAIKIGIARDVNKRIQELQIGNPCELRLIAAIPVGTRKQAEYIERSFHRKFSAQCIRGEWFAGNIKIKKFLDQVEREMSLALV